MKTRVVYILTVNYNCSDLVIDLAESILRLNDASLAFVVVDNSPHDPGLDSLTQCSKTTILRPGRNMGFGAGCNIGLDYICSGDPEAIVWLLNPDAKLLPGALQEVRRTLERTQPNPGILGTRICDTKGQPWFKHGLFNPWLGSFQDGARSSFLADVQKSEYCQQADWASGCSLILNMQILPASTRFDTGIFLYYEDVDLCLRLRNQGHPTFITEGTLVEHAISATTAKYPTSMYRHATFGKLYTLLRHGTILSVALNFLYLAILPLMSFGDFSQLRGRILGLMDFSLFLADSLIGRSAINRSSTASGPKSKQNIKRIR
jgi:N-acetylglucosaminyl-diphospho-decaprenol L-rhamnosyltransferase